MHIPPPPNPRELLPPLLACLPTAFVSPKPPPALLPLLSPVLRQRLNFLSGSNSASNEDGWLRLLSWDAQAASRLPAAVERMQLEPHPVSGEIEIEDTEPAKYKRIDQETLHARLELEEFDLLPTFVWCENDEHGGTGPGWKLTDLCTLEDKSGDSQWYGSPSEAEDAAKSTANTNGGTIPVQPETNENDNDDDYWAAYDRTPGQTPAQNRSPAPPAMTSRPSQPASGPSQSELDYYSRYGEVQPALDAHDPDEEHADTNGTSTLSGDELVRQQARQAMQGQHQQPAQSQSEQQQNADPVQQKSLYPADPPAADKGRDSGVAMPAPISPTSSHSSLARLEREASALESEESRAQLGIKQHISTDIKSLYRLAKSVGMDRVEFERVVQRELEVLTFMDMDE